MATERYTTDQVIDALKKARGLVTLAAQALECNPQTVRNYCERYITVAAALKEEREKMTDIAEASLYKQIQAGEGWAVCFYLKTMGKERGYVERQEYDHRGSVTLKGYALVSPDDWDKETTEG